MSADLAELRARLATAADAINDARVAKIERGALSINSPEWQALDMALAAIRDAQAEAARLHYRLEDKRVEADDEADRHRWAS